MNVENDVPFIVYLNNLNGFIKIDCLSEGGFSTVYSVKDKLSGDMYCIKSFEFDCSDPSKRKIFANYANKLFDLDFPSLIPHQFFSLVDLDNQYHPSFIYPYFSKQSLKTNINKLNNTHIMIILTGISEGLRYLHQNNFSHGALEPSNILLDDQFRPVLTSFGLGKMISKFNTIDPQISNRGSFNYMPPNHSIQQSDDLKGDIYRFGLIIYFLLSKKDPYSECQKIIHIPLKIMTGSLPKIPDIIPNDFANFIYKCWNQIPHDRPNIQEVCKELVKLRLPNVDIEKVKKYKEFLNKETSVSFNEFKKSYINQVIPQQQSLVDQKQANENEQFNCIQQDNDEQIRIQQEKEEQLRIQQEKEEQFRIQQEKEEQLRIQKEKEEQLRIQQEKEEQFRIQQEKEEQLRIQKEKEEQLRIQQEKEEQLRIQKEKEEQLRIQQEKEEQLRIQKEKEEQQHQQQEKQLPLQRFHIHQEKEEEELDFQITKDHQLYQQQYIKQQEKDLLIKCETGTKNSENNYIQETSSNVSAEDSLLSNTPKVNEDQEIEYSHQVEFQKDDYEPPPLPSTFSDDETMSAETQARRKSSRVRKARLDAFSESSSQSSESESDSYSATKHRSKRSPSKTSPSKSLPVATRSTKTKSKTKSKVKRKLGSKKEKRKDVENFEYDDDDDIDLSKFQIYKRTSDDEEQNAMFKIDDDNSSDDNESKIKDVISIQHPKKKRTNIKSDEYKFFENLSLSDEMKKLVELALSGDADSQNELGIDLIEGKHGIPKNPKMSFKMLDRAVKNNNDEAMINLGRCYEQGIGTAIDYASAFELYNSAFENSENESIKYYAASYLGHCFEEGIGCQVDKERAFKLYSFCFSKGIAIASYVKCLLFGTGVESNPQAAYELICSCEENEDNKLTLLKGICYEFGLGIEMNISEAINCYNRAIDQGNNEAIVQLALLLLSMGITSSSKQNNSSNFSSISSFNYRIYDSENNSYPKFDYSFIPGSINLGERNDPIQLLTDASSHLKLAKIHLGDCYLRGVGVDIDLRAAIRNYSNAANQCSLEGVSRYNLYSIPLSTKNITQIKSAAESQNDLALVIYGRLLQKEIATECIILKGDKQEDEALNLFRIASDDKNPIGMCQYGKTLLMRQRRAKLMNQNILFEGLINPNYVIDNEIEKEAVSLIKKSSDLKYKGGLYNYGRYILESIGVIKVDCGGNNIILIKNNSRKYDIKIHINFDYLDSNEKNNASKDIDMDYVNLAYSYLRMAADLGNNNARVLLGRLMKYGTFLNPDPKGALKYFDLARRSGSKAGIYYYSKMIIEEIDSTSNKELNTILNELKGSINWEKSSIRSKAMNLYGKCVLFGTGGLRINLNDVALYFKNASGYPFNIDTIFYSSVNAYINYGELLFCGTGVEKNKNEGIKCTHQALLLNENKKMGMDGKLLFKMGMAYLKGKEIKKDVKCGIDLLKIAAEKGNNLALLKCASFLMDGFPDILKENKAEAFRIYSFMAENDNDVGLLNAGKMLIKGIGVDKNEELGKNLIERAAELKNAEALQIVGNFG